MRRYQAIKGLLISLLILLPLHIVGEEIRIGFVDVSKAFDEYPETKRATDILNKEIEARRVKISSFQSEIERLEGEIEGLRDEEARTKKKALLEEKRRELREYAGDARTYLAKREQELTKEIVNKIYEAIKKVAAERKVSIVVEKNTILYGAPDLDLTEDVIKVLKGE
jgi:outer membrane protein